MTLCEALDWCRANRATVLFNKAKVVIEVGSVTAGIERASALTIEEAVTTIVERTEKRKQIESVAEAAKRGFKGEWNPNTKQHDETYHEGHGD